MAKPEDKGLPAIAPAANAEEREWAAALLAGSEPWVTLGISLEQCRRTCSDPEYELFLARCDAEPCGALLLDRRGVAGSPYVKSIAVSPGQRSHGIGMALMAFAENLVRGQAGHMFLCVSSFNQRARKFYERIGYEAVGEFKDYVIDGASEILMHKRLRQS